MAVSSEFIFTILGLFLTLCAFSLFLGDNWLFRLAASILAGALSAYFCLMLANKVFYPLVAAFLNEDDMPKVTVLLLSAAVLLSAVFLFCKLYTKSGAVGRTIQMALLAVSATVMIIGAAAGTIPAFFKGISGRFMISTLAEETKGDILYWVKSATVLICALAAFFYTRHYEFGKTAKPKREGKDSFSSFAEWIIGISLGALAAAIFITSANILVECFNTLAEIIKSFLK